MSTLNFFIGSYTQMLTPDFGGSGAGIYTLQLHTKTGKIDILHTKSAINPSYLVVDNDHGFLYCNTEVQMDEAPNVQAYKIKDDFSLELLNERPIAGGYPCHIEKLDRRILVACYGTGNVLEFPLDESGKLLECNKNHQHIGSSIHVERQEAPHAHQVAVHPNKKDLYVCDLGIDTLKAYHVKGTEIIPNKAKDVKVLKGGGPRHMVFDKTASLAYVVNELTGAVSVLKNTADVYEQIGTYGSLPPTYVGVPSASAIRIHPNGKFLYVGNRLLDAITIFKIKEDTLAVSDYQFTKGKELREFNISPDGHWLIACHQNSDDTVVYKVGIDGKLTEAYRTKKIKSAVCATFLK